MSDLTLKEMEKRRIEEACSRGGTQYEIASELGIHVRTLRNKIEKYQIDIAVEKDSNLPILPADYLTSEAPRTYKLTGTPYIDCRRCGQPVEIDYKNRLWIVRCHKCNITAEGVNRATAVEQWNHWMELIAPGDVIKTRKGVDVFESEEEAHKHELKQLSKKAERRSR